MTKGTVNTGTKSANKLTDLEEFNKTTQKIIIIKKKQTQKSMGRNKRQFANNSQQKEIPFMAVDVEQDTRRASATRQRRNTSARVESRCLGAQASRAALPHSRDPRCWFSLPLSHRRKQVTGPRRPGRSTPPPLLGGQQSSVLRSPFKGLQ